MIRISILLCLFLLVLEFNAQNIHPSQFNQLQWRCIGPHRGGRTVGAVGIPTQSNVFYIGVNNGGVWKTTDFGRTWNPIFDDQPTGSIGDIAISPSNPNTIYVGTGEGLQRPDLSIGNGIYKSVDGGIHWMHIGLENIQQCGGLAIDPKNENRVFVAALGNPYGPNPDRGIYKTEDGGKNWEKVLYIDENTGAIQVKIDPNNPYIVYADLWAARLAPWENGMWNGKNSGLFKSIDGGKTWKKLSNGLPGTDKGLGRIGFTIAPSDSKRLYATVDAGEYGGIYRSDDAGENWTLLNKDPRLWGRGSDFAEVQVDPYNSDIVYSANVVVWKSIDGGKSWNAFRGAPGGDDYHRIWINPMNPQIILIASDQGAIITVNGGETFSSWYNQPTAQFYHVSADNAFPYNIYSGQQESGSVGIASRGNDGQIGFREWHPVGAEEYGYVVADPKNPNIVYGGKISKFNKLTGQTQNISPEFIRSGNYRFLRTAPIVFSPVDQKTLYFAGNVLFSTIDGGSSWKILSPDLSRDHWNVPACVGIYDDSISCSDKRMARRGVIYTVSPSPLDKKIIWCGTDDGLIHLTKNGGKTWQNITPPQISSWYKISMIEASHFNPKVAYVAVNGIRTNDMNPHIYKTEDAGNNWKEMTNGLASQPINVVKEDPKQKGLLLAGSETNVSVSFDDGDHWNSLQQNMPASSIRDLCIKDNDLIVATHGRSFWIMDNIQCLRDLGRHHNPIHPKFYSTAPAHRVRWNMNTDTPLPQEEPAGQNPPDGAVLDYYLPKPVHHLTLEIYDFKGFLIRRFTNKDSFYKIPELNIPLYWIRPQTRLDTAMGSHRFTWDLYYTPLNLPPSFPIAAIYRNTAPEETSPWCIPGKYKIKWIADDYSETKELIILPDPRVQLPKKLYAFNLNLAKICYDNSSFCLHELNSNLYSSAISDELNVFVNHFVSLLRTVQNSDMPPTKALIRDIQNEDKKFKKFLLGLKKQSK